MSLPVLIRLCTRRITRLTATCNTPHGARSFPLKWRAKIIHFRAKCNTILRKVNSFFDFIRKKGIKKLSYLKKRKFFIVESLELSVERSWRVFYNWELIVDNWEFMIYGLCFMISNPPLVRKHKTNRAFMSCKDTIEGKWIFPLRPTASQ